MSVMGTGSSSLPAWLFVNLLADIPGKEEDVKEDSSVAHRYLGSQDQG